MKVVVVDDNAVNVAFFRAVARQLAGVSSTQEFTDPRQALAWSEGNDLDLLIIDYMMPDLDGLTLLKAFRALPGKAEIPVLMVTASDEREVRYAALNAGANDFLTKPVDRTEFMARARNMLAVRRGQKALSERAEWLAHEVKLATQTIMERELDTIFRLSRAAEYRDPETGAHVMRMSHYSRLIAEHLGYAADELDTLFQAAPMHDIGKVGTPDHILLKPGRLTDEEMVIMRQHATIGYEILKDSTSPFLAMAATIAHSHHEKWDGSGYPQGLAGEAIPRQGRIVAVADVFDALTSERPYKKAWSLDRALNFLREGAGSHFDPSCVNAFMARLADVHEIRDRFQDDPEDIAVQRLQLVRATGLGGFDELPLN